MTDPWDLARYLEEHPDDHEQRWRLAKKLYASWEYRHALEHLQVLQKEWKRHINVNRYLAATLYRLGRYDEAVKELREAVFEWPREVVLHEQLARVLEVAGAKEEAAGVWEQILELERGQAAARAPRRGLWHRFAHDGQRQRDSTPAGADVQ